MVDAPETSERRLAVAPGTTLLQFWDRDMPKAVAELVEGVRLANPSMEHRLYDDVSAAAFIHSELGARTAALYQTCALPAMRADLFRYCFLARRGGFYVDADYRALRSVDGLMDSGHRGMLYQREKGLANGVMYFREPDDPLAHRILDTALARVATRSSTSVWSVTGPSVLRWLHADRSLAHLFEDILFLQEAQRLEHFESVDSLEYKRADHHWLIARQKGLGIFRD